MIRAYHAYEIPIMQAAYETFFQELINKNWVVLNR